MRETRWNEDWLFWEEKDAFALVWSVPENARRVKLPHDAMLERTARADSVNRGNTGYRDGGSYVYVKTLRAPAEWRGRTVALRFDGVYQNALVYVNGQKAGGRPYGYSRFEVPLHNCLRWGEDNEIRVLVKNTGPNSRWYSGSGIHRDVWLLTAGPVHIPADGLGVTTREIADGYAALTLRGRVADRGSAAQALRLRFRVWDPAGEMAAEKEVALTLPAGGEERVETAVTVAGPRLWSAETPTLYRCTLEALAEGETLDGTELEFGIRTLALDARQGLRVNGETVKLRGACIHHDNGPLGAVSVADAELRRVRRLKEAGFNALRMAHQPMSPALLYACDHLGMYVMDEAFDMWTRPKNDNDYALAFDRWWRADLADMVAKDYSHPSVIFYSLGNEIPEVATPLGAALGREMYRLVKGLDPTRFALVSVNGVFAAGDQVDRIVADLTAGAPAGAEGNVNDFMAIMDTRMDDIVRHPILSQRLEEAPEMDLMGYNYMTARYEPDGAAYPHRVIVGSETYPPEIARNWPLVEKLPYLVGDFTWTGWDYIGEAGIGTPGYRPGDGGLGAQFPCQLAYCGDLDVTGFRRPVSYFREIVYGRRQEPYIAVQPPEHWGETMMKSPWIMSDANAVWSYPGMDGKPVVVEVYAPGDRVELFRNGVSLGTAPAGAKGGWAARFETTYEPGTLLAVCWEGDTELGRTTLETAGAPAGLTLEAEAPDPLGTGEYVYVDVICRDEAGRAAEGAPVLRAEVSGGGTLAGFGSGDPRPETGYLDPVSRSFHGRALLIVRRSGGPVTVAVADDAGHRAELTLE